MVTAKAKKSGYGDMNLMSIGATDVKAFLMV